MSERGGIPEHRTISHLHPTPSQLVFHLLFRRPDLRGFIHPTHFLRFPMHSVHSLDLLPQLIRVTVEDRRHQKDHVGGCWVTVRRLGYGSQRTSHLKSPVLIFTFIVIVESPVIPYSVSAFPPSLSSFPLNRRICLLASTSVSISILFFRFCTLSRPLISTTVWNHKLSMKSGN